MAGPPDFITVFDAQGRPVEIARTAWVTDVLPASLKREWNDPQRLAALITSSLRDGFASELRDAARRLQDIDPDPAHVAVLRAVVELRANDPGEAERILTAFLATNSPTGLVLTNLAKAEVGLGRTKEAEGTLDRALELDPNQENGLDWMVAIHRERGGEEAVRAVLTRLAAKPGAWRPQLLLGRGADSDRPARGQSSAAAESHENPTPEDITAKVAAWVLQAGLDDWVALAWIEGRAKYEGAELGAATKVLVLDVVEELVTGGLVELGAVTTEGYTPWTGSIPEMLATIDLAWTTTGPHEYGYACWTRNTPEGDARARERAGSSG